MKEKDLKDLWKSSKNNKSVKIKNDMIFQELESSITNFDKNIKRRNLREILAGGFVVLVFTYYFFIMHSIITKIGIVIILSAFFIIYKLLSIRKKPSINSDSLKEYLKVNLSYTLREAKLLETVEWWYISPIALGVFLFFLGLYSNLFSFFIQIFILIILSVFIKKLNKKALKEDIYPLIKDLEEKIINITE